MELGEFNESIEGMIEEADLSAGKAKKCKLRIVQQIFGRHGNRS